MEPTLEAGDLLAINKFAYQMKVPPINHPLAHYHNPSPGEVVVFSTPSSLDTSKYPGLQPLTFYVKRIIAGPGDHIVYKNKQYIINDVPIHQTESHLEYQDRDGQLQWVHHAKEQLGLHQYHVQLNSETFDTRVTDLVIPQRHYFVSGDNRDHSLDSRYFGPIPQEWIVGQASHIITHFQLPTIISFSRTGPIN